MHEANIQMLTEYLFLDSSVGPLQSLQETPYLHISNNLTLVGGLKLILRFQIKKKFLK